jgi:hypothetical protein
MPLILWKITKLSATAIHVNGESQCTFDRNSMFVQISPMITIAVGKWRRASYFSRKIASASRDAG